MSLSFEQFSEGVMELLEDIQILPCSVCGQTGFTLPCLVCDKLLCDECSVGITFCKEHSTRIDLS